MKLNDLEGLIKKGDFNISTDTRTVSKGDIYVAIKGDVFDGNSFVKEAFDKGASLAIMDNPDYKIDERCILVENSKRALAEITKIHRSQFSIPIIVIGGSNGKTTTKELVSAVLATKYKIHTTKGNLNNDIGVPLTILAMPKDTEIAIVEIGANHIGEHEYLINMVSPTHAIVTNNGMDHLEGFGSINGVRKANKEIYDWIRKKGGHVFVNKDLLDLVEDSDGIERILYPEKSYRSISTMNAELEYGGAIFNSNLFGSYNEPNILASIVIGEYFDVPLNDIQKAIASYVPTLKRSQIIRQDGYSLVLDCYNANPSSMELALKDFFKTTKVGERIILIGDMLEMGEEESHVHKEILELLKSLYSPKDIVMCVGPRFAMFKNDFPFNFFDDSNSAREYFNKIDLGDKFIFVKASRGIKIEDVIKEKVLLS